MWRRRIQIPLPLPLPLPPLLPPDPDGETSTASSRAIVRRNKGAVATAQNHGVVPNRDNPPLPSPSLESPMAVTTVVELHRRMGDRRVRRIASYDTVLAMCMKRVSTASSRDYMRVLYEVPEFVMGIPPYDVRRCMAHMMTSLREAGFIVRFFHPRTLYVSWDPSEMYESASASVDASSRPECIGATLGTTLGTTLGATLVRASPPSALRRVSFAEDLNRRSDGRVVLNIA